MRIDSARASLITASTAATGISGIAAGTPRNFRSYLPGIFQRGRKHAGDALAQAVEASAPVERADRDLQSDAAAITRRPNDRADHLPIPR